MGEYKKGCVYGLDSLISGQESEGMHSPAKKKHMCANLHWWQKLPLLPLPLPLLPRLFNLERSFTAETARLVVVVGAMDVNAAAGG